MQFWYTHLYHTLLFNQEKMKILILLFAILISQISFSQNIQFNDTIFKLRLIEEGIDTNFDNEISISEAEAVSNLNIAYGWFYYQITDLSGIEYFINIDTLDCSGNLMTSIDLTNNQNLIFLNCAWNYNIDTLILGYNESLEHINLDNINTNNSIDFSGVPNLKVLEFRGVNILDVSNNTNLEILLCEFSACPIIVSSNTKLIKLICKNQESLDLSNNPLLEYLDCKGSTASSYKLDEIDLSNNQSLKSLNLWYNNISQLDLTQNVLLEYINCGYNQIHDINFENDVNAKTIVCLGENLTNINVTNLTNLEVLVTGNSGDSTSSNLYELDVSTNINLKELYCASGNLTSLDLSNNIELEELYCGFNNIDSLILCSNFNLTYINFADMPQLGNIYIPDTAQPPYYYSYGSPNFMFVSCNLLNIDNLHINESQVKIYPNPAENQITIEISKLSSNSLSLEIIDELGRIVKSANISDNKTTISIEDLRPGIYYCRVSGEDIYNVQKIIRH